MTDFRALCAELVEELVEARESISDWAGYASSYIQEKHDVEGELQRIAHCIAKARAADLLERQHPQPIPVAERLPEAGDCDAEGRSWIHMPDIGTAPSWRLVDPREIGPYHTHWLPAHDLPLPSGEVV